MIQLFDLDASYESDPAIASWWATKAPPLAALAKTWWDVMRRCAPEVREASHNGYPSACLDVYPFAYVDAFTAHVNVGFYYGAFLPDPKGILIGSGKRMRHVKVFPDKPGDDDALREMILGAHRDLAARIVVAK